MCERELVTSRGAEGIHQKIVDVGRQNLSYLITHNAVHHSLEGRWRVAQLKTASHFKRKAFVRDERSFWAMLPEH